MPKYARQAAVMAILIAGGLAAACSILYHFYYLFPNSNQLFQVRHNHVEHLEFYTDRWDYHAGDVLPIYASSSSPGEAILTIQSLPDTTQFSWKQSLKVDFQPAGEYASVLGLDWESSGTVVLPESLESGWYLLSLRQDDKERRTSLFVTPHPLEIRKRVAFLFSTNTWNAYNHWGGQSLYSRNYSPTASFRRPQLLADPFLEDTYAHHQLYFQCAARDLGVWQWGALAEMDWDAYPIETIHDQADDLSAYDIWICSTHPEYWSREMIKGLNHFLDQGGSLMMLGGNVAAYVTEVDRTYRSLSVCKDWEDHWRTADTSGMRPFGTQYELLGFHTYAPYEVLMPNDWSWEGTGVQVGTLVGEVSDCYDYTYMYGNMWEWIDGWTRKGMKGAASGMEIDKLYEGTPDNFVHLASGLNPRAEGKGEVYPEGPHWENRGGADLGYYLHPGGGMVFTVGSIAFSGAVPHDERLQQLLLNVMNRMYQLADSLDNQSIPPNMKE
ncbi:N,N-dimethylformamidase beta subunit family domain-containing protein [Pontibacter sp. G13]|uniref:N,N-dimethylformamidase beta subunit family domain-containing protein n=1 Tax=Pontibacter sp. G13 TaxID=3074898 RepID=UPI00288A4EB1|nr:N,N-dimethylformamidase beta subunit family domain-containing protein [Pontibacter sp. G13]WNJ16248.1 hypothetical protein RJD25_15400 [Pontibacter sp. G13]